MTKEKRESWWPNCRGRVCDVGWGCMKCWDAEGVPHAAIARRLNCHRAQVGRQLGEAKRPSERPKRTPPAADQRAIAKRRKTVRELAKKKETKLVGSVGKTGRRMRREVTLFKFPTGAHIARELGRRGAPAGVSTVRRDLTSLNIKVYRSPKGPARKEGDRDKRLGPSARCPTTPCSSSRTRRTPTTTSTM